ncbi:unnamed protein product [Musa acuminata subsp. malaccensis]|uniref:(wild Malaysian banana) hypothetical protein n=1 Tax=Musa acuminata subsp. malaccensis TaxID=214687 RepID=A0A8D7FJ38_MUSAM|nr:unnamed protein product [Musa acuminata subsp. malaccensis]
MVQIPMIKDVPSLLVTGTKHIWILTFGVDSRGAGIVTVSAKDKATGKEQQITIRSSGGLSLRMRLRLWSRRPSCMLKNSADTAIYSIEKNLSEYKDKIPAKVASDLRKEMAGDKIDSIKAKLDAAYKAGSSGGSSSSGGSQGGDRVPEADYEEVKK